MALNGLPVFLVETRMDQMTGGGIRIVYSYVSKATMSGWRAGEVECYCVDHVWFLVCICGGGIGVIDLKP